MRGHFVSISCSNSESCGNIFIMYENFYGLSEKPFHIAPNPEYLYFSSKHKSALTYLEYGIREGAGFILLTGEIGTGKTTLIRYMLNRIEAAMEVAVIFNTNVTGDQLLELVLQEFDLKAIANNKTGNLEILYRYLIKKYARKERVLLIIDEAQNLRDDALEEVRMLSNLQTDDDLLLQIVLVGQPELKAKLKRPSLAQLAQRIAVNYHLTPLSKKETRLYIASRLEKAGGSPDIFTTDAVNEIFRVTNGIPRSVNLVCDSALVYAYGDGLKTIDQSIIERVVEDKGDIGLVGGEEQQVEEEVCQAGGDGFAAEGDIPRLASLETGMQQLKMQVQWQVEELEKRAENYKDDLVRQLRQQLEVEKRKHEKMLIAFGHLKEKYNALYRLHDSGDKSIKKDDISRGPRKKRSWF